MSRLLDLVRDWWAHSAKPRLVAIGEALTDYVPNDEGEL